MLNGWKKPETGEPEATALWGKPFDLYAKLGYENGRLGFPITDVYDVEGKTVTRADFEGGSIEIDYASDEQFLVLSGKRVEVPLADAPVPPSNPVQGYTPTVEEQKLTPLDGMEGGISHFANPDDASTRGRKMGISGEPADNPNDQWYCAMRFNYCQVRVDPNNEWWVKPVSGTSDLALKNYLPPRRLLITNPANGKQCVVRPADWGPGAWAKPGGPKYRVIDVSATAVKALGAQTDTFVRVAWCDPNKPLGPVQ